MRFSYVFAGLLLALPGSAFAEVSVSPQLHSRALPPDETVTYSVVSHVAVQAPTPATLPPRAVAPVTIAQADLPVDDHVASAPRLPGRPSIPTNYIVMAGNRTYSRAIMPVAVAAVAVAAPVRAPVQPAVVAVTALRSLPAPVRVAHASSDSSLRCVAMAVFHEARGEPLRGQRAVADVIMNRARSGRWGGSACNVVDAPHQFSNRNRWSMPVMGVAAWDRAVDIARDAMSGMVGVSSHLMNFRAARLGGGGSSTVRIGGHVFW